MTTLTDEQIAANEAAPAAAPETRKPTSDQMMAGYAVACRFGVLEARAFDLAEKMFAAMQPPSPSVEGVTERPCALCSGRGFYGTPGVRCAFCDGTGKTHVPPACWRDKLDDPASPSVPAAAAEGWKPYEAVPPSAAEWFADCPGIANHDWRGGWDACRNRCRELVEQVAAPASPSVEGAGSEAETNDSGPLREGWSIMVGPGHAGFGAYAVLDESHDAGAVCLATFDPSEYPNAAPASPSPAGPSEPVAEVVKEADYWSRGHFYEGTRTTLRAFASLDKLPLGTKLYAASPAGVQGDGVPAIVIQWRDAYGSYIAAMDAYNDRVQYIRDREAKRLTEFGRDNPTGEWRAVDAASAKWHSLLRPMFEALAALPAGRAGAEGGDAAGGNEVDRG